MNKKADFIGRTLNYEGPRETLVKFSYFFTEKEFKYGEKIFSEGDQPTKVFLIKKGEIEVFL